jgi:aspartyl-tRNA(Asn)/glutamyl-tRNA(Gln) amidotransferase subunit A
MSDAWRKMTASGLGRAIGAKEIDPRALTDVFLAAADAHPSRDDIYTFLTPERARAEADAAAERARHGTRRGLLDGVPISWKDLYDTVGDVTRAGSAMTEGDAPAAEDAEALARATRAGMVCLGKTHMTEMAFSGLGVNPVTATSPNINGSDAEGMDWAPGGSSSGAGASVAFDLAPAGIGSDTGGSVRIPSAWQNLVGLKTTLGLIPVTGSAALAAGFDTVGPLCKSVEDAAEITAVMAGTAAPDLAGASLAGKRVLVDEAVMLDGAEDAPRGAFEDALARLEAAGAEVVRETVPEFAEALKIAAPLITAEAWAEWGERIEAKGDRMFHQIRKRTEPGRDVSAATYLRAWKGLEAIRRRYAARVRAFDVVAAPTCPILPPSVSRLLSDDAYYERVNLMALRNTRLGNLLGLSSLTLPTARPACGLMFFGAPFGEAALCRVGAAAEAALAG